MPTPGAPAGHASGAPAAAPGGGGPVVIVPYRDDWPVGAASLIADLRERLRGKALRIEHIGSTAIPGMAAKDVIDLQASVASLDAAARDFDGPLGLLGFHRMRYESDHVPAGLADDPARWAKRLWRRRGHPGGDVNLHVRVAGSPNERLALLFRDWFRAHPRAVPAYAEFKRSLASVTSDLGGYTDAKDPVVDLVVIVAETWAAASGWQP
jgi:GrpB-like predicted nucleotidyltransferase (UPF0157 family)